MAWNNKYSYFVYSDCRIEVKNIFAFQYRPGNVGIIISIPHGGLKDDSTIPERTDGFEVPNNLLEINVSLKKNKKIIELISKISTITNRIYHRLSFFISRS